MNLFYVFEGSLNDSLIGVYNKIRGQKKAFESYGYNVLLVNIGKNVSRLRTWLKLLNPFADHHSVKELFPIIEKNSVYYFRFMTFDFQIGCLLKKLRANNNIVVIEIPTYPFSKELSYLSGRILYLYHLLFLRFCLKNIHFFVTYSTHNQIYNIKSIPISNGIDIDMYPVKKNSWIPGSPLVLLIVARTSIWHGIDRVIEGLKKYYENKPVQEIILNVVGEGDALPTLKSLVRNYNLDDYVKFWGTKIGHELDAMYDISHIGIASLGCHRINIYSASMLKSREYLVRGFPFICSVDMPDIPSDFEYVKYFSADDSYIDMEEVLAWAKKVYEHQHLQENIKNWARMNMSWRIKLESVVNEINTYLL